MEKEIKDIDQEIAELLKNNAQWNAKVNIITSVPGVGRITAGLLIAALPELGKIKNKEIAALVGVAPFVQQSGTSKGVATIKGGRSTIRTTLYMAAVVAMRHNPVLKVFYDRLRKRNKCFKVAIVAVMRKIIILLNVMLEKGECWRMV